MRVSDTKLECRVCHSHINARGLIDLSESEFISLKKHVQGCPKRLVPQFDVMQLLLEVSSDHYKDIPSSERLKMINFDDPRLCETDYMALTGLKKADFDAVVDEMQRMRHSSQWSRRNSVGVYLTRLRTGILS